MNKHQLKLDHLPRITRYLLQFLTWHGFIKARRWLMRYVPFMKLKSDVTDVVYLSWLVDVNAVMAEYPDFVPFWQKEGKTIFTILTYQHHHFGLAFLGPLRKFFPSPKQSNWRFYLARLHANQSVIFEQVIVDQLLYVFGGRLASDVMPAQLATQFKHQVKQAAEQTKISTQIELDDQYSFAAEVHTTDQAQLPQAWQDLFNNWQEAVLFLADQAHAWSQWSDDPTQMSQGDIMMPIQLNQISPAQVKTINPPEILKQWTTQPEQEVFAFVVSDLCFHVQGERELFQNKKKK
ncbi:hypothetical protein [Acinetobacter sp. MD2(2019)]|uniref:hypothetical protein n=1 Tax=Acinetobacter sp. MD2(2019) TaxID=2605273 RepID=UPI002D1E6091|nr:hypothetical protein [Acinetobacter sp. MD2(2019)]MEB3753564.1 DUF2071 domain-containing protein [Acinetobacter sp. MD2(2019)]